jgi:hypothetical protein
MKMLQSNRTTNTLLAVIAVALTVIAVRPYMQPTPVAAQTGNSDPLFVEPGVFMLRVPNGGQVLGKVVTNLRTGGISGFPTGGPDPYPVSLSDSKPQVSRPIQLGRFALGDATH